MSKKQGFTLVELLVVISIIGLLSVVVLSALNVARGKAQVSKAKSELNNISSALALMVADTGKLPYPSDPKPDDGGNCTYPPDVNEVLADSPDAGIKSTDGNFPGWAGPYMNVPLDPWGSSYIYDEDYLCNQATPAPEGCKGLTSSTAYHRALVSGGPNKSGPNVYDSDNVVRILCPR